MYNSEGDVEKTEIQQAALDELVSRRSRCSFASKRQLWDCNDPRSVIYEQIETWCYNCLCDELEGAKINEQDTDVRAKKGDKRAVHKVKYWDSVGGVSSFSVWIDMAFYLQ